MSEFDVEEIEPDDDGSPEEYEPTDGPVSTETGTAYERDGEPEATPHDLIEGDEDDEE